MTDATGAIGLEIMGVAVLRHMVAGWPTVCGHDPSGEIFARPGGNRVGVYCPINLSAAACTVLYEHAQVKH